ncbi:uncharacterized protein LOC105015990 [Esox lucius]|uniref:uncharacterized protein LOC105015990 n=1 Tax=Esox lucius TaxID=8010 RepID=UPI0005775AB4|nr:uncharacterized protein LOC105015990 [Esox lucius]
MSTARLQQNSIPAGIPDGSRVQSCNGSLDKLAFKYKDMCKVVSSTDSESDVSPRWSDTSTMGCASSATESRRPHQKTLTCSHKPVGRYFCHPLSDPYDGSSEDSDGSMSGPGGPRQGSRRYRARAQKRTGHHPAVNLQEVIRSGGLTDGPTELHLVDVQMRSTSDSELWTCSSLETPLACNRFRWEGPVAEMSADSGVITARSTPGTPGSVTNVEAETSVRSIQTPGRSADSPVPLSLFKRKFSLPGVQIVEAETRQEFGHRKRQCFTTMGNGDSSPENKLLTR